ncbi:MAG TPA: PAS domain S-box protein [Terriglobales bacterium]|nr:PAS domain S-box protein [Terriglobales bacterium]
MTNRAMESVGSIFHDAFTASPIGIVIENLDGQPLFVNPAFCSMLGFTEEELRNKHCVDFSPAEDAAKDWTLFQQLRAGLIDHYHLDKRYFRRDGSLVWGRLSISLLNGHPSPLVLAMVEDITEKKKAEDALRDSEERLRLAQQAARMGAFEVDIPSGVTTWEQELEALYGLPPGGFAGTQTAFEKLVHPDDLAAVKGLVEKALKSGKPTKGEWRTVWPDGSVHWIGGRWQVFMDEANQPLRMVGVNIDIAERKAAEEELKKSEEKFSKAFRSSPMLLALTSARDYRYLDVNETFERATGWRRDEIIGRTIFDVGIWAEPNERIRFAERLLTEGSVRDLEIRFRRKDGSERVGLGSAELIDLGNEPFILSVIADITERKHAEDLWKIFVKNVPAQVAMLDREMRYIQASDRWCSDYSLDASQLIGRSHYEVFPDVSPTWKEMHSRALEGEILRAEEDRWDRADGTTMWVRWEIRPWTTSNGDIGGIVIFAEDITRRKQMEEALSGMSRKLIESQEQERARIARELHDDICQRLAMLAVDLERLQTAYPDARSGVKALQERTGDIASDVQALSHDLHSSKLDYLGVIAGIRSWCREFGDRQNIKIDFRSQVSTILAMEVGLCLLRVVQESLHNIVKHSGVKRAEVLLTEASGEVRLAVKDSGIGFDAESAKQSTGVGLISMRERVRLVNGTMSVDSKPMRGTIIRVCVPVKSQQLADKLAV